MNLGIRTVLFTDIVGSTALTQELGDEDAMELVHLHDKIVRAALESSDGREVKHTGDGIMASFVSAAAAIKCAAQIQRASKIWVDSSSRASTNQSMRTRWRGAETAGR